MQLESWILILQNSCNATYYFVHILISNYVFHVIDSYWQYNSNVICNVSQPFPCSIHQSLHLILHLRICLLILLIRVLHLGIRVLLKSFDNILIPTFNRDHFHSFHITTSTFHPLHMEIWLCPAHFVYEHSWTNFYLSFIHVLEAFHMFRLCLGYSHCIAMHSHTLSSSNTLGTFCFI